jgi:aminomethyltransferase
MTSAMRSPLKKHVALARIDVAHSAVGTEVEIGKLDGHQMPCTSKVSKRWRRLANKERPRS